MPNLNKFQCVGERSGCTVFGCFWRIQFSGPVHSFPILRILVSAHGEKKGCTSSPNMQPCCAQRAVHNRLLIMLGVACDQICLTGFHKRGYCPLHYHPAGGRWRLPELEEGAPKAVTALGKAAMNECGVIVNGSIARACAEDVQ